MNCQRYRKWISDAALDTLNASRLAEVKIHLADCPECRRLFEAEQRLCAAIDRGVTTSVDGTPSAHFAAGVRMRLAEELKPARAHFWRRPGLWSPALALGALAVLILTLWFVRRTPRPRVPERVRIATPNEPAQAPPSEQTAAVVRPKAGSSTARPRQTARRVGHRTVLPHSDQSDEGPQLEVLVDPGEKAALAELVRTMQRGADPVGAVDKSVESVDSVQVQPVQVKPVTIAELQTPKPIGSTAGEENSQ